MRETDTEEHMLTTRKTSRFPLLTPFAEVAEPMNRIAKLFEPFGFEPPMFGGQMGYMPPIELIETPEELILTCELPGLTDKDIELVVENNVLTLRGEKKAFRAYPEEEVETEEWKGKKAEAPRYLAYERIYGAFVRSFTLPTTINANAIKASVFNGVLEVHMPKVAEAKGRRIEIGHN